MYRLVLVKYLLKSTKLEIWVNWYLTDTNQYLTNITNTYKPDFEYQLNIG